MAREFILPIADRLLAVFLVKFAMPIKIAEMGVIACLSR
jgi:hypothetical protein